MNVTNLLFSDPTVLPIVTPREDAGNDVKVAFSKMAPGSIAVAMQRTDGMVPVYYEGGIYSRPENRPPTLDERIEYAKIAAGRAIEHYPTIAFFVLPSNDGLRKIGEVDTATWNVIFYDDDQIIPGSDESIEWLELTPEVDEILRATGKLDLPVDLQSALSQYAAGVIGLNGFTPEQLADIITYWAATAYYLKNSCGAEDKITPLESYIVDTIKKGLEIRSREQDDVEKGMQHTIS